MAKKAIALVSGLYVWCSPEGTQGLIKTLQVSLLAFFLSFPPFQALTLRPLRCESKKHTFTVGAYGGPAGEETGKSLAAHRSAST